VTFEDALEFTLKWEGGYANHPNDPGGETYRGIARAFEPGASWEGWRVLDQMMPRPTPGSLYPALEPLVASFYREHYWEPVKGDELPGPVAVAMFDHAVHSGVPRASRALQDKVDAVVDGRIGPKTILRTWAHCGSLGALELVSYRGAWLARLAERRPSMRVFSKGWQRRIDDLGKRIRKG
jgi:lysozyme family protein